MRFVGAVSGTGSTFGLGVPSCAAFQDLAFSLGVAALECRPSVVLHVDPYR